MKDRKLKDTAASVRQRLLNLARERGDDFKLLLSRYRFLAQHFEFDAHRLGSAISATFNARGSALPQEAPLGLTGAFALDTGKAQQWRAFLRRTQPRGTIRSLPETIADIRRLLLPVLARLHVDEKSPAHWRPEAGWLARDA